MAIMRILSSALAGVRSAQRDAAKAARQMIPDPPGAPRGDDAMVRGAVGLMRAERDQAASVAVARTGDEMLGTLLDVVA
ncbi:MAG: hypothetical protein KC503_29370 [Myxococcales bacterium]|nr:hypothetical protein [Myxococcales bacterium]